MNLRDGISNPQDPALRIGRRLMQQILITGASGFIGRNICELMLAADYRVRCVLRRPDMGLEACGAEIVLCPDFTSEALMPVVAGCDVVVHCAGDAQFGNGSHYEAANVYPTEALLDAITASGATAKFIFLSSIGAVDRSPADPARAPLTEDAVPHPSSEYGRSKLKAEERVRASGLRYTILRPAMVVGPNMRPASHFNLFANAALRGKPISRLAFPGRFSVIHVSDLAAAVLHCSRTPETDNRTFFCAGEPVALHDFWRMARPDRPLLPLAWLKSLVRAAAPMVPFSVKGLFLDCLVADDKALRDTGWTPTINGVDALSSVIEFQKPIVDFDAPPKGVTVVTGAASGLGRALALQLAPIRHRLILVDKNKAALEDLQQHISHAEIQVLDLTCEDEIKAFIGRLYCEKAFAAELYGCAGLGFRGEHVSIPVERHLETLQVNLTARLHLLSVLLPEMCRRHFGRIILISSSSAFQPLPLMATYAATNAAILSMAEAVAQEIDSRQITVSVACPGGMQTNFQRAAGVKKSDPEKLMTPEQAAFQILKAVKQQRVTLFLSARTHMMALLARFLPRKISVWLWHHLMGQLR